MKIFSSLFVFIVLSFQISAQNIDINILRHVHSNRNQNLDHTFELFSKSTYPIGLAVPVALFSVGLINKDKHLQGQGLAAGASLVASLGTSYVLKRVINRPRPYETYLYILPYVLEDDPSFPSGHTTAAFATATSLSLVCRKWYVVVPAYAWAGTVAYSRLHLGVHYPSDILAGAVIGAGTAWAGYRINRWLQKKRK